VSSSKLILMPATPETMEPIEVSSDRPHTIGRGSGCSIRLAHGSVSKEHARLEWTGDAWRVTDLESLNGTSLNNHRLPPLDASVVRDGDLLGIGAWLFRASVSGAAGRVESSDTYATRETIFSKLRTDDTMQRELVWEEFRRRYAPVIVGFARNAGLKTQDAEDVLQEVMLGFFKVSDRFVYDREKGRFRGYLKRATLNVIRKRLRKRGTSPETDLDPLDDEPGVETRWEACWRHQIYARAIEEARPHFDARTFEAFELYGHRNVPAAEVARRLGLTPNGVHQAKSRVLAKVTEIIERIRQEEG
jgi:RNA polymerase sigma factor (sigma-70 family)